MHTHYLINIEDELSHLVDYIQQTWILPKDFSRDDLVSFIKAPFEAGLNGGRDWCKNTSLSLSIYDNLYEIRNYYLEKNHDDFLLNDGYYYMINSILNGYRTFENSAIEDFRYESFCRPLIRNARKIINKRNLSPKPYGELSNLSYKEIRDEFNDFDTFGYWENKDSDNLTQSDKEKALFKGKLFETAGSFNFIGRTTIHYVLQSDVNQGRDPLHELIAAIITHGLNVAEFNNTAGSIETVLAFKMPKEYQYSIPELPDNRFLKACFYIANKKNDFKPRTPELEKQFYERKAYIASLSKEELEKMKQENHQKMKNLTSEILAEIKDEENQKVEKPKEPLLSEVYKKLNLI